MLKKLNQAIFLLSALFCSLAMASDDLRVQKIFNQVQKAAHKKLNISPKLKIVIGKPNNPFVVVALPDGTIELSKSVIKLSYRGVSKQHGDARIAFILGHELAHISNGDFLPKAFTGSPEYPKILEKYRGDNGEKGRKKEIEADEQGFVYAAMAGYAVDNLLSEKKGNFFLTWQRETDLNWQPNSTHPPAKERAKGLYKRLKTLLDYLPYFQFGVRLSHFNRCNKSMYFFSEFLKHFPAREVYNNLGICELQKARIILGSEAYLYWLPSVLDVKTQLEEFSLPYVSKGERQALAKKYLIKAKKYFQSALDMEASYIPANVNLAITEFYLGEFSTARTIIEKLPENLDIKAIKIVILYEEAKQYKWIYAIKKLEKLAQQPNAPLSILYNLAQLWGTDKKADKIWQKLAQQAQKLPIQIRRRVCKKTYCQRKTKQIPKKTWNLPVKLGIETFNNKTLSQWQVNEVRLYDLYEEIYQHPDGSAEILALGGEVKMVVLKKLKITINELPNYCGQALRQRRVVNGTLLSCNNWATLVVDDKVEEVWVIGATLTNQSP